MKCIAHEIDYCPTCNTLPMPKPFTASFAGWTTASDDWGNPVTVQAVEHWDAGFGGEVTDTDEDYADRGAVWELVETDTNYKPSRPSQHPVRLTRPDAVKLAGSVLEATEDTFHYSIGRLRPIEAKELLEALQHVEYQLNDSASTRSAISWKASGSATTRMPRKPIPTRNPRKLRRRFRRRSPRGVARGRPKPPVSTSNSPPRSATPSRSR
jgi:hypothetical protein